MDSVVVISKAARRHIERIGDSLSCRWLFVAVPLSTEHENKPRGREREGDSTHNHFSAVVGERGRNIGKQTEALFLRSPR